MPRVHIRWQVWLLPPLVIAALYAAGSVLVPLLDRPVRTLVVQGAFQRVTPIQIEAALAPGLEKGFLSLDLGRLKTRLEKLDWVETANLRREWPDRLVVQLTEHRAAARWGDSGLLDERGDLFAQRAAHAFPELPELDGPPGSEHEVASLYLALRHRSANAQLAIERLRMDERGAWYCLLKTGQEIRFGRRDLQERVNRFFDVVQPALAGQLAHVRYVDLRYTNGFAVGWLDGKPATGGGSRYAAQGSASHG
ncbi:MAG TPA: cell division protein FtsQ/DivIB [Gammaproteobacteria bacterium]|nr:cell division protein FtsQ/DivIB [Gammaproteobacteria bacterium]